MKKNAFFKLFYDYLKEKLEIERKKNFLACRYVDVGNLLWYLVLWNDLFADNPKKLQEMRLQNQAFLIYVYGEKSMNYGPIVALSEKTEITAFCNLASRKIYDLYNTKVKIFVTVDGIVVTWK